ncbi:DNA topoisomerase 3-alpha [Melitaea cinxia]|uniref:DNA topoisomerase 3-alpha n=1 Tax=Melitaea cinxia TaxID=113334 RepID=UPI001E2732D7|nr:DNA topoisomerase 3-alpha [Melitaea cinxia]
MKYLNVAEKNDAAKNIALHLSRGTSRKREGFSQYNKIYEFDAEVMGQKCEMVMTSVSGHLLTMDFVSAYKSWQSCNPLSLFDAPVYKYCPENYEKIKKTLEREVRSCQGLIIWTDCDREGENIGFEIIEVCMAVKNNIKIFRAKFSEITSVSVKRALQTLSQPNKNISDAVDVRQELDLRIGAAFTRFQTLRLQKVFPRTLKESLVSYGSCQFPTLGFVVERYRAIENFVTEPFWKLKVNHTMNNLSVDFLWERIRVFDQVACQVLHDICLENPQAKVTNVKTKPKSKWRPLPLDTVELEKLASRKLRISAKETMQIAEKLYTQGFISYPRTETNEFPKEMNLGQLVGLQTGDPNWGTFAQNILDSGGPTPRQGNKSDQAHPPIHPTKYAPNLSGNEQRLYEFIVRSFLACCSKDAQGQETTVHIEVAKETFSASGLMITARNYLEVYPYDKWSSKEIHVYETGQIFNPTSIDMIDGSTSPPNLLTEADLITLMEKHGIGTDATHAEHIEKIKSRSYVTLADARFVPGVLGMGLVEGYDALGQALARPHLRAQLEAALRDVCDGRRAPRLVLADQIAKYKEVYLKVTAEANKLDEALTERLREPPMQYTPVETFASSPVFKCPKCNSDMVLRQQKNNADKFYISCVSFPKCKNAVWLPTLVKTVNVLSESCSMCGPSYKKLKFEWRNNSLSHLYPPPYIGCLGGCDRTFLESLQINISSVKKVSGNQRPQNSESNVDFSRNNRNGIGNSTQTNIPRQDFHNRPREFVPPPTVNRAQIPINLGPRLPSTNSNITHRMPTPSPSENGDENNVMCKCNKPASLFTVRKQNENQGKKFYKCSDCDFFLWAPDSGNAIQQRFETPPSTNTSTSWGTSSNSFWNNSPQNEEDVKCACGLSAKKIQVRKEGPTKGRFFYGCPNDLNSRCDFFQWAEGETNTGNEKLHIMERWSGSAAGWDRSCGGPGQYWGGPGQYRGESGQHGGGQGQYRGGPRRRDRASLYPVSP